MRVAKATAGALARRRLPVALALLPVVFAMSLALFVDRSVADLRALALRPAGSDPAFSPTSIDSVERDAGGELAVRGSAPSGAVVLLFDGDRLRASALAGPRGFVAPIELEESGDRRILALRALSLFAGRPVGAGSWSSNSPILGPEPETAHRSRYVPDILRGDRLRREIVLSLDAGSSDAGAREILAVLRREGVRTTLFLTGEFIRSFPELVREAVDDGHEFGNHTWNHPHLTRFGEIRRHDTRPEVDRHFLADQLARTAAEFEKVTGRKMAPWWRAPFGEQNAEIRRWAADLGWRHVGWTPGPDFGMDSLDWVADESSARYESGEEIVDRLLEFDDGVPGGAAGGIILMHLGTDRRSARVDSSLARLISGFREKGLEFVTVSRLLGSRRNEASLTGTGR